MEYYWGYAAANAPLPNIYQRTRRPPPARSQSTNAATSTKKSRIPGHRRTTSSDSFGSQHSSSHQASTDQASPTTAHSGAAAVSSPERDSSKPQQHHHSHSTQHRKNSSGAARPDVGEVTTLKENNNPLSRTPTTSSTISTSALASGSTATSSSKAGKPGTGLFTASNAERALLHHAGMAHDGGVLTQLYVSRNEGAAAGLSSSSTHHPTLSNRTMVSSDAPSSAPGTASSSGPRPLKPFVIRNGRTYLSDPTLPYPLPVDLAELHRQSLRTLLLFQLFGGPVCSPEFEAKPPVRVLEVGCGSGFWSMMCHRYYARQGHSNISFTGLDMAPMGAGVDPTGNVSADALPEVKPDKDMRWHFVQHDMRRVPWPVPEEHFDLVMVKDLSLAITNDMQAKIMDEYLRVLRPGGTLEIWESDHTIRMLRPHVPDSGQGEDAEEQQEAALGLGAYTMSANTPLSAPLNPFIVEYNGWIAKALDARSLSAIPCTSLGPLLLQESETLKKIGSRRLAIPLSEVKWEREGVGGVVTKDGKNARDAKPSQKPPSAGQMALRKTALLTIVQFIQSMEPMLREISGKSQDEWDGWAGKMMSDLMKENGTSWGECLEVGAWWAKKRKRS